MNDVKGNVAVVAGASRGAGRGIALALGEAGATVYVVGRTTRQSPPRVDGVPGTIEDTAEQVTARGGKGIAVQADCRDESAVAAVFQRVEREHGKLDVLANAVYGASDSWASMEEWTAQMGQPFWEHGTRQWNDMMQGGPYAYYLASTYAARIMAKAGKGLIVGVTDGMMPDATEEQLTAQAYGPFGGQLLWDLSHLCINRLMAGMSVDLKKHNIAAITLMPGFMQTETVLLYCATDELKKQFRFDLSESPEYIGRAVVALANDKHVLKKTGRIHFVGDLAKEYGFTDIDGRYIPRFNPA